MWGQYSEAFMRQNSCKTGKKFSLLRKTGSDGDARSVSRKLFQTDAAAAGKAWSPMVARTVRGATSADARYSRVQSRGDSKTM